MIDDSVPWRHELRKAASRLQRWDEQARWSGRTYFLAERDIMMGAYSIRRLIDSGRCSSRLPDKRYSAYRYARIGRIPMHLDRFSPESFYDVASPTTDSLSVARLCNQIIHSFVFQICAEEDSTAGVVFVSDRDKHKHLYGMSFQTLAALLDYVGREDVVLTHGTMRAGVQTLLHTSNHDLVEDGRATYLDEDRVDIDWQDETDEDVTWKLFDHIRRETQDDI